LTESGRAGVCEGADPLPWLRLLSSCRAERRRLVDKLAAAVMVLVDDGRVTLDDPQSIVGAGGSNVRAVRGQQPRRKDSELTETYRFDAFQVWPSQRLIRKDGRTLPIGARAFDVLVGINLLREGLDLPEVAFIAILDADKEGYLRGYRSLIQTIGRAARHLEGRVIMYADKRSEAMEKAISETDRRRAAQLAYNREHGITAASIEKAIYNIETHKQQVAEEVAQYEAVAGMPPDEVVRLARRLERDMGRAARELQFEKAALLRDQLIELRKGLEEAREKTGPEPAAAGAGSGSPRTTGRSFGYRRGGRGPR